MQRMIVAQIGSILIFLSMIEATKTLFGLQSKDVNGSASLASSMVYDAPRRRIYMTGATNGFFFDPGSATKGFKQFSDCFLGVVQLPTRPIDSEPIWLRRACLGDPTSAEACTSIFLSRDENDDDHLSILGHTETRNGAGSSKTVFGMVLDMSIFVELVGGYELDENALQLPVSVHGDPSGSEIYVATLLSDSTVLGLPEGLAFDKMQPAEAALSIPETYYSTLVQKFDRTDSAVVATPRSTTHFSPLTMLKQTVEEQWRKVITSNDGLGVQVTSIRQISQDLILVAGFKQGIDSFGKGTLTTKSYVGFLEAQSGNIVRSMSINAESLNSDRVHGACHLGGSTDVFLVGTSSSSDQISVDTSLDSVSQEENTFLVKVNADTMRVLWSVVLDGFASDSKSAARIQGSSCTVTPDGNVFVAGTARSGASIVAGDWRTATKGKDDIFVGQVAASDGTITFLRQIGTSDNDELARGDGGIVADEFGNVIVLGNTRGSFARQKSESDRGATTDVVVFLVERDTGNHFEVLDDTKVEVDSSPQPETEAPTRFELRSLIPSPHPSEFPSDVPTQAGAETLDKETPRVGIHPEPAPSRDSTPGYALPVAAIAVLLNIIFWASLALIYMRQRKQKNHRDQKYACVDNTLQESENGQAGPWASLNYFSSVRRRARRSSSNGDGLVERYCEEESTRDFDDSASFSSRITLRMPPKGRIPVDRNTLLSLEPVPDCIRGAKGGVDLLDSPLVVDAGYGIRGGSRDNERSTIKL